MVFFVLLPYGLSHFPKDLKKGGGALGGVAQRGLSRCFPRNWWGAQLAHPGSTVAGTAPFLLLSVFSLRRKLYQIDIFASVLRSLTIGLSPV